MSIGIGNEHEVSLFQVVLGANEVLRVTTDGQFVWNPDADRMIEESDFSFSPAMPHILRALRKRPQPVAPVQEPVAWVEKNGDLVWQNYEAAIGRNLYTSPAAQRQWVGLTDEERMDILLNLNWDKKLSHMDTALAIEAKLKEKNT